MFRRALRILHWSLVVMLGYATLATALAAYTDALGTQFGFGKAYANPFAHERVMSQTVYIERSGFGPHFTLVWSGVMSLADVGNRGIVDTRYLSIVSSTNMGDRFRDAGFVVVTCATWLPIVAFGVYPILVLSAVLVRTTRRFLRSHRGCCARCGYDLRGSPSGRCPECGTKFGS